MSRDYGLRALLLAPDSYRSASLRNRDRHQFGMMIAIPRNPQLWHP
jgi:hypothetical protein